MSDNETRTVGAQESIRLNEDLVVTLKPVSITVKKKVMKRYREIQKILSLQAEFTRETKERYREEGKDPESVGNDLDFADKMNEFSDRFDEVLVDCSAICIEKQLPSEVTAFLTGQGPRELYEDIVDEDTVSYINKKCAGIDFTDSGDDEDLMRA